MLGFNANLFNIHLYMHVCKSVHHMFLYGSGHLAFEITVFSITDCELYVNIYVYIHNAVNGSTFSGLLCFI